MQLPNNEIIVHLSGWWNELVHLASHYIHLGGKVYCKGGRGGEKGRRRGKPERSTLPAKCCSTSAPFCSKPPPKICLNLVFPTPSPISDSLHQALLVLTKFKDFYSLHPTVISLGQQQQGPTLVTPSTVAVSSLSRLPSYQPDFGLFCWSLLFSHT